MFEIDSQELIQYLDSNANSCTVLVTSNIDLTAISNDSSWCKAEVWKKDFTPTQKIDVSVLANPHQEKRSTEIVLKNKEKELAKIQIAQLGVKPAILLKEDSIVISDDLNFKINLIANTPVCFELPDWITEKENSIEEGNPNKYEFTAQKLPSDKTSRMDEVVVKGLSEDTIKLTLPVLQTEGLPRFIVISDLLIGRNNSKEKLIKKLQVLLDTSKPIDAVFFVGDLTEIGASAQYAELKNICDSVISNNISTFFMMGNSDHYLEKGESTFRKELNQPLHQYFSIKGYPFITLSMTGIYTDRFTQEDKKFLSESLKDAKTHFPDKPIFFFTHIGISDTYYGTEKDKSNLGSQVLKPVLEQFPELIAFSGHTNFSLSDPRSIHQNIFTSVNIGGGTFTQIEYGYTEGIYPPNYQNVSEGLVVSVQKNGDVEIERWDVLRKEKILPQWTVKSPHDGSAFSYKNRTGGNAPSFADTDSAQIGVVQDGAYRVKFPQATDDEMVHHYIIEVLDNDNIVLKNTRISQFYLNSDAPKEFTVKLFGIPTEVPLVAQVKAVDSYGNISLPLIGESFTISPFIPDQNAQIPIADLFDVKFQEDGNAKDISPNKIPITTGEIVPEVYYNIHQECYIPQFNGNQTAFYKVDYTNNEPIKKALINSFALETFYLSRNLNNSAPLSGKEWEGLGIEQEKGGQIEFWAYIDDKYKKVKSSVYIQENEYYHVVAMYDKNSEKMTIYVNGKKSGEIDAPGNLIINKRSDSQWFCIGGDTHPSGKTQHTMNGEVVIARMYSRTLSDDEVFLLYRQTENKK
ncbi:MAG: hypothetical protein LBH12_07045 [Dysgonamonadaceae bacterium]|nr:hypothetical protein [Dysgonamonadaceae bacterium]